MTRELAALALCKVGLAADLDAARARCIAALDSGAVTEAFARMVSTQGGPGDLLDRPEKYFAPAPVVAPVPAPADGWLGACDTTAVGMAVVYLGGGRQQLADKIDSRVGLTGLRAIGERIERGAPLAVVHAADEAAWSRAARALTGAYEIRQTEVQAGACIIEHIDGANS